MTSPSSEYSVSYVPKAMVPFLVGANRLLGVAGFVALPMIGMHGSRLCHLCDHPLVVDKIPLFYSLVENRITDKESLCLYEIILVCIISIRLIYIAILHNYVVDTYIGRLRLKNKPVNQSLRGVIYIYCFLLAGVAIAGLMAQFDLDPISTIKTGPFLLAMLFLFGYVTPEVVLYARALLSEKYE